jgi:pyruvate dehydrogenase E2 component (dihydrolipoamide acetyltransferase)
MTVTLAMPRLADTMEEGTIVAWLKSPGDTVERGEEICEIEMEKASMSYESHVAGRLVRILVDVGGTVFDDAPTAEIDTGD